MFVWNDSVSVVKNTPNNEFTFLNKMFNNDNSTVQYNDIDDVYLLISHTYYI